jgi:hypothetical protein
MEPDAAHGGPLDVTGVAAHAVLRGFAWKLPGFGACSLAHLWANFLDVPARAELAQDRIVVRMSPPPLELILRLAGLVRGTHHVPRINARTIHILPEN